MPGFSAGRTQTICMTCVESIFTILENHTGYQLNNTFCVITTSLLRQSNLTNFNIFPIIFYTFIALNLCTEADSKAQHHRWFQTSFVHGHSKGHCTTETPVSRESYGAKALANGYAFKSFFLKEVTEEAERTSSDGSFQTVGLSKAKLWPKCSVMFSSLTLGNHLSISWYWLSKEIGRQSFAVVDPPLDLSSRNSS